MVSRKQVAVLPLLWLQEQINVLPGLGKVLYSDLLNINLPVAAS